MEWDDKRIGHLWWEEWGRQLELTPVYTESIFKTIIYGSPLYCDGGRWWLSDDDGRLPINGEVESIFREKWWEYHAFIT